MKVLIVNVNAYSGSTGKITKGLYDYLVRTGHEVKVCYRGIKEKHISNPDFIPIVSRYEFKPSVVLARLTGLESHFSFMATRRLKRFVRKFKPDVVQLYNIHGNYIRAYSFLEYLKDSDIPVVYSMLDEFAYMGKCPYPVDCEKFKVECGHCPQKSVYPESWLFDVSKYLFHKKKRIYEGFDKIIFTGPPFVCKRANGSFLLKDKQVEELYEPFSFKESYFPRDTKELRKKLGYNDDDRVIMCASGTRPRKGGQYFIEVAKKLKDVPNLKFIFVGYDRTDWKFSPNVTVKGFISDSNELAEYMSIADAYVCTSVGDTTPSVCLAALGCGTPLIGFDYGGVVDCAPNEFGTYVPIGDIDALAKAVAVTKKKTTEDSEEIRAYAVTQFSPENIYEKQVGIYNQLLNG